MKIVIACGGTGGHLFPGLAVAQALKDRGNEVLLLVSEKAIDAQALKSHPDFKAEKLPSVGLPAILSPAFLRFLHRAWDSLGQCKDIYRRFQPDAVLGMGGFTSTAPLLAARLGRIPAFIHEANSIPGKANRIAGRFVDHVLVGFDACRAYFAGTPCTYVGTPVRKDLGARIPRAEALAAFRLDEKRKTLLVMGGSQGASGINQLMFKVAPMLKDLEIQVIHLTGERDDRLAAANYLREHVPAYVSAFHHRMQEAYSAADLVVSRAGAASLSELSSFELPMILIPYPHAADNHQQFNAQVYVEGGAAEMLIESQTSPEQLGKLILGILSEEKRRDRMSHSAAALAAGDSAAKVASLIEAAARKPAA